MRMTKMMIINTSNKITWSKGNQYKGKKLIKGLHKCKTINNNILPISNLYLTETKEKYRVQQANKYQV